MRGMLIRRLRVSKKLSALSASLFVGISQGSYCRIESGERDMKCEELLKIAELFEVHASYILGCKAPVIKEEHVYKIAIDHGFEVARQIGGNIGISPRLVNFAQAVVTQIHS